MQIQFNFFFFNLIEEWFKANVNNNLKPPLSIPNGGTLVELRNTVRHAIYHPDELTVDLAMNYLYEVLLLRPNQAAEAWTSFGRQIVGTGGNALISCLAAVVRTAANHKIEVGQVADVEDHWMCMYICCIYRLIFIDRPDYRMRVAESMNNRLRALGAGANFNCAANLVHYVSWKNHRWYKAFMSFIDMYYHRFPRDDYADLRIGTIYSRHLDCATLLELIYLKKIVELKFYGIAAWAWSPKLADCLCRVFWRHEENELEIQDSYAPYLMHLGLSNKSPYSASVNPELHYWIHVIGCCHNITRSVNARMVGDVGLASLTLCGLLFGYVTTGSADIGFQFTVDGDPDAIPNMPDPDAPAANEVNPRPKSRNGAEWFLWFMRNGRIVPADMQVKLRSVFEKFVATRDGTVGRYLAGFPLDRVVPVNPAPNA